MNPLSSLPPPPPNPPAAPKVFGVINLIFGALAAIGSLSSFRLYFTSLEGQTGVMPDLLRSDPFLASAMRILVIPGALMAVLQFASGLGLLRYKEWARKAALVFAVYGLVVGTFAGYLNIFHTMPFTTEFFTRTAAPSMDPSVIQIMRSSMLAAGIFGVIAGIFYHVMALIFLTRPKVRVHCIAASSEPENLIA